MQRSRHSILHVRNALRRIRPTRPMDQGIPVVAVMQLIIPTRGRTNRQLTLQQLPDELLKQTTLVCPKNEAVSLFRRYKNVEMVIQPDPTWTIARKRKWIM